MTTTTTTTTTTMESNAEALFKNRTLEEIREVERRTRREAREKSETLRNVVGESYKDAMATVEAMERIREAERVVERLAREARAEMEARETRAKAKSSATTTTKMTTGKRDDGVMMGIDRGSRVKFLLDAPEVIWGKLEDCEYRGAMRRLLASTETLTAMTTKKKETEELYSVFPVVRQQAVVLSSFKAHISKRARSGLERPGLRAEEATSALSALVVVENLSAARALELLLQTRQAWVRACLRDISSSSTTPEMLNKRLSALMSDVKHVLKLSFEIFAGSEATLFADVESTLSADDLFPGVFEPQGEWERFQASAKERRSKIESLSEDAVREACTAWLNRLADDISRRGVAVFGKISSCEELVELEVALSSDDKAWEDTCKALFKHKLSLWSILFAYPWLQQGFALFKKSLSFAHIKPQVDGAVAEAMRKADANARGDLSVWSGTSKDAKLAIPEDVKHARAVAQSLNATMLAVRKDALMLQGVQLGGVVEAEGRLASLAEHIQTCAHKGLIELAHHLLNKLKTSSEVSCALMVGHLAQAIVDVAKETNILLKPVDTWTKYNESAELIVKPVRTLRGMNQPNEPVNPKIEGVKKEFETVMNVGYRAWVTKCTDDLLGGFRDSIMRDPALVSEAVPIHWEEVSGGSSEGLSLRLPTNASSYVVTALHGALQEAQRIGGHLLSKSITRMLAFSIAQTIIQAYSDVIGRVRFSEKGTLQVLFDIKFAADILAESSSTDVANLQKQLVSALDPIDWATYEPFLWENERRAYRRCAVLLGGFVQLENLYQDTSIKPAGGASSATASSKPIARFTYLPVSLPTLRGGLNADGTKSKIDWGEIEPDTLEDEEREGLLSSFMQSSRIGLGNILREFA